ncbi:hypothetical protein ABZP36_009507 [Zizania latifolia]
MRDSEREAAGGGCGGGSRGRGIGRVTWSSSPAHAARPPVGNGYVGNYVKMCLASCPDAADFLGEDGLVRAARTVKAAVAEMEAAPLAGTNGSRVEWPGGSEAEGIPSSMQSISDSVASHSSPFLSVVAQAVRWRRNGFEVWMSYVACGF